MRACARRWRPRPAKSITHAKVATAAKQGAAVCEAAKECAAAGRPELAPHKVFEGDRPSSVLLFRGALDARRVGQLLALYEHRTAVQGWFWGVNSFDQYGVELGKVLAKDVGRVLKSDGKLAPSELGPCKLLLSTYLAEQARN